MADEKKDIQWMYEGPKSEINREDYLLGKKIDKNFIMYSDVAVKDRDEMDEVFLKKSTRYNPSDIQGLSVEVARHEDPLTHLKLREERHRLELLNNPKFKLKAEQALKKEFEKMKRKAEKKEKKKSKKRTMDSSDECAGREDRRHHKERKGRYKD